MVFTEEEFKKSYREINKKLDIVYNMSEKIVRIEEHMKNTNGKVGWLMGEVEMNSTFINGMKGALKLSAFGVATFVSVAVLYFFGAA